MISASLDAKRLERMWFFVPRMLHQRSLVLLESSAADRAKTYYCVQHKEIDYWASNAQRRKAA